MKSAAPARMDADAFQRWAGRQRSGRYELDRGEVVPMAPERAIHVQVKTLVWLALRTAAQRAGLGVAVLGDGLSVRVDRDTVYEPDALVLAGPIADDIVEVGDALVIVEVSSPSSSGVDSGEKLAGYMRLPSCRHYLVVNARRRTVVHHARTTTGAIETEILVDGLIDLDPPGLTFPVAECFPA